MADLTNYIHNNMTTKVAEEYFRDKGLDSKCYEPKSIMVNSLGKGTISADIRRMASSILTTTDITKISLAEKGIKEGLEHITDIRTDMMERVIFIHAIGWRKKR